MARRANPRAIKASQSYEIEGAAEVLGVSNSAVRAWIRQGLPVMTARRPYLILGDALREFLQDRKRKTKVKLKVDQVYCLSCKMARSPFGMMADYVPQTAKTGRLVALCSDCGSTCNRMISHARLPEFQAMLDVAFREGLAP